MSPSFGAQGGCRTDYAAVASAFISETPPGMGYSRAGSRQTGLGQPTVCLTSFFQAATVIGAVKAARPQMGYTDIVVSVPLTRAVQPDLT